MDSASASPATSPSPPARRQRVMLLGATGTIGQATARALVAEGHEVVGLVRPRAGRGRAAPVLDGVELRFGDVTDPDSLARDGFRGETFDALVTCLASRTGAPRDAWAIDHRANALALAAARNHGVVHVVLLSAICVQKPLLAFQQAKLAFEAELMASGLTWSIVRPTAFFKSLSGQVERVRAGKPFLVFGDGTLTACKPISDGDLARYIAGCLTDPARHDRILPSAGRARPSRRASRARTCFASRRATPLPAGAGRPYGRDHRGACDGRPDRPLPRRQGGVRRIGRYYATESMLVLDPATGRYDAAATPSTGSETLFDFYARLIAGEATVDRGDHAVF